MLLVLPIIIDFISNEAILAPQSIKSSRFLSFVVSKQNTINETLLMSL